MVYDIRPPDAAVDPEAFHCGQPPLDNYIRRYASQDVRRRVARVFVAPPQNDARRLADFFSLSAGSVSCEDLPPEIARKLPRNVGTRKSVKYFRRVVKDAGDRLQVLSHEEYELLWGFPRFPQNDRDLFFTLTTPEREALEDFFCR